MRAWCWKYKRENCSCSIYRACQCLINQATTLIIIFLFSTAVFAGVGTESLQFLKIKPSARVASLGDGFVGLADDSNASFYNPAGLAALRTPEISLMHLAYIGETSYECVTGLVPAGKNLTLGGYVIYLNYGSINKTGEDGSGVYSGTNGAFNPYNLAGGVSAGYKLSQNLSVGAGLKYAAEDIDGNSISGIMGDAGVLYTLEGIGIGASLSNIGAGSSPMMVRLGVSTKLSLMNDDDFIVALGGNYVPASGKTVESIGVEYCYDSFIIIRGSYGIGYDVNNVNVGAGVKQNLEGLLFGLDYNFSLFGDFGSAHRISLSVKFGDDFKTGKVRKKSNGYKAPKYQNKIRRF